jgi:DNA-binding NtrC family response regulator
MQEHECPLIFVVEDNWIYNNLVVNHLRSNKFQKIESFVSGEECLKNLYKKPDIVVQDYHMDGLNGIDVLKESKKRNPDTEFIFLSGDDSYEIAANTLKYGAFDYLVKDNLALKKLIVVINKIIKTHRIRDHKNHYKVGVPFFLLSFALFIITLASLPIIFPKLFTF